MRSRFKPGDLVVYQFNHHADGMHGIVLAVTPMEGTVDGVKYSAGYRGTADPGVGDSLEVLWDRDVPFWMGEGRISYVTDSVVNLLEEVLGEAR